MESKKKRFIVGWNEWCSLSDLNIPMIKAKIDTGAKTSSLGVDNLVTFKKDNQLCVQFDVYPIQHTKKIVVSCKAPVADKRYVMSSNGRRELRYVIEVPLTLGEKTWMIELTLANREPMTFRMLLGREALASKVLVNPARTLCLGRLKKGAAASFYTSDKLK